jgi:hypothetical protein
MVKYPSGTNSVEADLSSLPSGIYVYTLNTEGRNYSGRMIINR